MVARLKFPIITMIRSIHSAIQSPRRVSFKSLFATFLVVASSTLLACNNSDSNGGDTVGAKGINVLTAASIPEPAPAPSQASFAGTSACATCHSEQFAAWSTSTHGSAGGTPGKVIAPFNGSPIVFSDALVIPRLTNGKFSFTIIRAGERDTVLRVDAVIGGGHMAGGGTQGYVTAFSDGTLRFLPFDWSRQSATWFCNTATRLNSGWQPITRALRLADCGDWPPQRVLGDVPRFSNCQSCHGSQIDLSYDTVANRWQTAHNGFAINCESCHGPGAKHVELMKRGPAPTADIGMTALATQDKDASITTCLSCHALKDRLSSGWRPGAPLSEYYSIGLSQLGDKPHTEDGRTRTFAYQEGHLASDCYRNGGMTCTSCHDPHSQGYRTVDGTPLPGRVDDRQCTSCHASKSIDTPSHTKHRAESAGSRCVSCHMPYQQEHELGTAIKYARSDHTIAIPRPVLDSSLGISSACRTCHTSTSEAQHAVQIAKWWGELKPHEAAVKGLLDARAVTDMDSASILLLQPDSRNTMAQVAGMVEWLDRFAKSDMARVPNSYEARLRRLSASTNPDVKALSLAILHLTHGNDPSVRKFLAEQRHLSGVYSDAVNRRWVIVLGDVADAARAANNSAAAIVAYRKALEVAPLDPALLVNLGLALAEHGDLSAAVAAYQTSLRVQPRQPIGEVNLGLAFERAGNEDAARGAYHRAIAADPTFAVGYLNLGTSLLRQGNGVEVIAYFERALARDDGLSSGHFQLALARLGQGDLRGAAQSVRRSLVLDPFNVEAQKLEAALREANATEPNPGYKKR